MTENQSLGHPAQEPDTATEARVRARVTATVRLRRARRRAMTALPVIAVIALVAVAVANTRDNSTGQDRQVVTAGHGDVELAFEPDVEWDDAVLSADGKTLTVTASRVLHNSRSCQLDVLHDVVETDDAVTIGLKDATAPEDTTPMACKAVLVPAVVKIPLNEPLGDRAVFDGVRPKARTVLRLAELVQVTYVPAGFTTNPDDIPSKDTNVQQTYNADGADWYFAVNETKAATPTDLPGATSTPILVNDIEGVRITGQMNNTMESIRFPLGGRTVTVWGEMQGPPTFTHADELQKIAEGIRLLEAGAKDLPAVTTSAPTDSGHSTGAPKGTPQQPTPQTDSFEIEVSPESPYAIGIRKALDLGPTPVTRVTRVNVDNKSFVHDSVNTQADQGLSATIYHDCALFLTERGEPDAASSGANVWIGVVNDELVTLGFYNPETGVALSVSYTSADHRPVTTASLTATAARLSAVPAVVEEVGGGCE